MHTYILGLLLYRCGPFKSYKTQAEMGSEMLCCCFRLIPRSCFTCTCACQVHHSVWKGSLTSKQGRGHAIEGCVVLSLLRHFRFWQKLFPSAVQAEGCESANKPNLTILTPSAASIFNIEAAGIKLTQYSIRIR